MKHFGNSWDYSENPKLPRVLCPAKRCAMLPLLITYTEAMAVAWQFIWGALILPRGHQRVPWPRGPRRPPDMTPNSMDSQPARQKISPNLINKNVPLKKFRSDFVSFQISADVGPTCILGVQRRPHRPLLRCHQWPQHSAQGATPAPPHCPALEFAALGQARNRHL